MQRAFAILLDERNLLPNRNEKRKS